MTTDPTSCGSLTQILLATRGKLPVAEAHGPNVRSTVAKDENEATSVIPVNNLRCFCAKRRPVPKVQCVWRWTRHDGVEQHCTAWRRRHNV